MMFSLHQIVVVSISNDKYICQFSKKKKNKKWINY